MAKRKPKPAKVTRVRKDSRGRFRDQKGRPVAQAKAKRFKTYFDAQGRRRSTKTGQQVKGGSIAPTRAAKRRRGVKAAFKQKNPIKRAGAQRKLLAKRKGGPKGVIVRRKGRSQELADLFGIKLRTKGDFETLVESQGREIGRASFSVDDPIGTREDRTIRKGITGATERATQGVTGLVAISVTVHANGDEVGTDTVIVRADERPEVIGGVMASVFRLLGEAGLDASDGTESKDRVDELEVELVVYALG